MKRVLEDFDERAQEVSDYLTFLRDLEQQIIKLSKVDKLTAEIVNLTTDIINVSFDPNDLFSGNVDAREIRKLSTSYGFSTTTLPETRDGIDLLSIKTNRNNLAHGFESFNDVGKETTAENLIAISERVIKYLRQILNNIDEYLVNTDLHGIKYP